MTADARYESEENYSWFEVVKNCYIKPANYVRRKQEPKNNMALREDTPHDAEKDGYTCQAG